jgi:large subunit ribosomal protein L23
MQDIFLIKQPHITEKATGLNLAGKYVFVVKPSATKGEVKKAVKELYRVDATAVNIVNLPGKTRRYRGLPSKRSGSKKAIVTLKEGQKIDLGR